MDVYIEKPVETGLFVSAIHEAAGITLSGGLRYDRFDSRASRPSGFPRISSMPGFDPAHPTALFKRDRAHGQFSPRVSASYALGDATMLRFGYAREAELPEFGLLFAGVNTDLTSTNFSYVFGTDMGYAQTDHLEIGIRRALRPDLVLGAALYNKALRNQVTEQFLPLFDPVKKQQSDLLFYTDSAREQIRGLDLGLFARLGEHARLTLAYAYADAKYVAVALGFPVTSTDVRVPYTRPHTLSATVQGGLPSDWKRGSPLAFLLQDVSVGAAFRYGSGTAYGKCPPFPQNVGALSGFCGGPPFGTLPAYRILDLRIARGIAVGRTRLSAFVDARNLLNWKNITTVFAASGATSNLQDQSAAWAGDSNDFASEAQQNGHFLPNGTMDLTFGGTANPRAACGGWKRRDGLEAEPNCVSFIRAEERFGNGDHVYTVAEQKRASLAFYETSRGLQNFTGSGRRVRLGLELEW
jgi:outer membrane receptor protein involved in Fe transport